MTSSLLTLLRAATLSFCCPFGKTEQCGGESISSYKHSFTEFLALEIPPFVLYPLPEEEAHLCPVRAITDWIQESKLTAGFLFRRIASGDHVAEANVPMVCLPILVVNH
jgi:hypothetical protein